jgi:hypothetical protein
MTRDPTEHSRMSLRIARRRVRAFTAAAMLTTVFGSAALGALEVAEDPGTTIAAGAVATTTSTAIPTTITPVTTTTSPVTTTTTPVTTTTLAPTTTTVTASTTSGAS